MLNGQAVTLLAAWGLFLLSLFLPCVDVEMGGEYFRGVDLIGLRCLVGVLLASLAIPEAIPVWMCLTLGNLQTLFAPMFIAIPRLSRKSPRIVIPLSVLAAVSLGIYRDPLGIKEIHIGYYTWLASLVTMSVGLWLPKRTPELPLK